MAGGGPPLPTDTARLAWERASAAASGENCRFQLPAWSALNWAWTGSVCLELHNTSSIQAGQVPTQVPE